MKNDEGNPIHGDWQNLTMLAEFQEFRIIGFDSHTVTQAMAPTMVTDDKALILALQEKRKEGPQSDQSKFSVNMHTATLTQDTPSDNIDDVLLAMVTQHSNRSTQPRSHPGDIRSVLPQPTTKMAKATSPVS
jgi:hypothetical protein